MKKFNILFLTSLLIIAAVFIVSNLLINRDNKESGRPYRVEIKRLCNTIETGKTPSLSDCQYVTKITKYEGQEDFYDSADDYVIKEAGGTLYRFDYRSEKSKDSWKQLVLNLSLALLAIFIIILFLYIRKRILAPFNRLSAVPYELSKGKLSSPLEEQQSRYFGKFVWGVNMLRENMLSQKQNELKLLKDRQTLILSISHDIKTPLSAIKLYSKAMSKGLYTEKKKIIETAENINNNADKIEKFVTELTKTASEDFIKLDVENSEFYQSQLLSEVERNYHQRLKDIHTAFDISGDPDCLLRGDLNRSIEVIQNLMENAIKYGDGKYINIEISEEDGCRLICVANSGCSLPDGELLHIFDSFWRGSNAEGKTGSGLGLFICRQLMLKMDGEIFAEKTDDEMRVTAVFRKA